MTSSATHIVLAAICTAALQLMSLVIVQAQGTWAVHTGTKSVDVSLRHIRTRAFAGTCGRFCGFAWIMFWAMQQDERAWELQTCRIEIDAFSLCCSFVIAQVARYYVGGVMPNPAGTEQHGSTAGRSFAHSPGEIVRLPALALTAKFLSLAASARIGDTPPEKLEDWASWARWVGGLLAVNTFSKTTGWLLLFTTGWVMFGFLSMEDPDASVQVRTIVALICSYFSFAVIGMLDTAPGTGKQRWKDETLASMGLMTGFSWRRCYGLTIDLFTSSFGTSLIPSTPKDGEHVMEICLSLPFVAILMPAHYYYIVPNAIAAGMT